MTMTHAGQCRWRAADMNRIEKIQNPASGRPTRRWP